MSETPSFTSEHYPYLPVTIIFNKQRKTVDALLDTGFEGDIIIPEDFLTAEATPDSYLRFTLADPTATVLAPSAGVRIRRRARLPRHLPLIEPSNLQCLEPAACGVEVAWIWTALYTSDAGLLAAWFRICPFRGCVGFSAAVYASGGPGTPDGLAALVQKPSEANRDGWAM